MKYSADGWWGGEERPLTDRLLEMQGGDSVEKEKVDFHITRVGEDEVRERRRCDSRAAGWDPQLRGLPPTGAHLMLQLQEIFHPKGAGTVPGREGSLELKG